jgi:hypothetical protein
MQQVLYWLAIGLNMGGALMNLRLYFKLKREDKTQDKIIAECVLLRAHLLDKICELEGVENEEVTLQ